MRDQRIDLGRGRNCADFRRAFTLVEVLVVVAIVAVLVALLMPAVQSARESARRTQCANNVRQIGAGLQQHHALIGKFPLGAFIQMPGYAASMNRYDPRREAAEDSSIPSKAAARGWSWMVEVLPYVEQAALRAQWDNNSSVMMPTNRSVAVTDIPLFYCPSRRSGVRSGDQAIMFQQWRSGGTDYGGCLGGGNGFRNDTSLNAPHPDLTHALTDSHQPSSVEPTFYKIGTTKVLGIFSHRGPVAAGHVRDGLSQTLAIGELQRLLGPGGAATSLDGWAVGGISTLFDTFLNPPTPYTNTVPVPADSNPGGFNNGFYESAGSEHPGGANFGMADGSVRFLADDMDKWLYQTLGSYAGREAVSLP